MLFEKDKYYTVLSKDEQYGRKIGSEIMVNLKLKSIELKKHQITLTFDTLYHGPMTIIVSKFNKYLYEGDEVRLVSQNMDGKTYDTDEEEEDRL